MSKFHGMICPICGDPLEFMAGAAVMNNVDSYQKPATAKTKCCKSLLRIYPVMKYDLVNVTGREGAEDEWGYE